VNDIPLLHQGLMPTSMQRINNSLRHAEDVCSAGSAASDKAANGIIDKGRAQHPCTAYKVGDIVLVRTAAKDSRLRRGGKKVGSQNIKDGVVTACQPEKGSYKVCMGATENWVKVQDLASPSRAEEMKRRSSKQALC